ncbi:MAG: type II secretion system F family protein [Verrucomicrobiae bacterium]|nr:type II secretion system F family protein [Verrucomicrobiae bacterium]
MKFSYTAIDDRGKEQRGELEADNESSAISKLREMGYYPTQVLQSGGKKKAAAKPGAPGAPAQKKAPGLNIPLLGARVGPKVLVVFTRQLATLINAGLPLLKGLAVLQRQERNPTLKFAIQDIASLVEGGSTFSEALYAHSRVFNKLYINMVKAGEIGGVLDVVLNRLADFQEKAQKIKGKVTAAMFYPIAVLVIAGAILMGLMIFIVPKFQKIFVDMLEGEQLPAFTQLVIGISNTLKDRFFLVALGGVAIFICVKLWKRTTSGRKAIDTAKLHMPVFGDLMRKSAISRFTRTLGTLLTSGVPILQALQIVKDTSGNFVIENAVQQVHDAVKEGESIVQPLEASKVFPPMVVSMIDVGEQTGALPDMLMRIADAFDNEVDNSVSAITSLIEPIMIVLLAVIVGSIVIAMFLPLLKIIQKLSSSS